MESGTQQYGPYERLLADVDHALDAAYDREKQVRNFLQILYYGQGRVNDWEDAVRRLSSGSSYQGGDLLPGAAELLASLSEPERVQLRDHYFEKLTAVQEEFPNLKQEFPEQFR
jgi:hypothetical protein